VPAEAIYEPNYETGKAVWWRTQRADGEPMALAGLWERKQWHDARPTWSFTMLTVNAEAHPVMRRFHKPGDEKRTVVVLTAARSRNGSTRAPGTISAGCWCHVCRISSLQSPADYRRPQKPESSTPRSAAFFNPPSRRRSSGALEGCLCIMRAKTTKSGGGQKNGNRGNRPTRTG